MKLAISTEKNGDLVMKAIYKTKKEGIDYIKMIKALYEKGNIEDVQYDEDVPEKDRIIINAMIEEINKASIRKKVKGPRV
jgi:phosphoheptose isomerase